MLSRAIFNLRKISLVFAWRSYHRVIIRPPFIMLAMKKLCRYNIVRKTFMGKCLKCVVEGNFMILIPYSNTTCIFIPFLLLCKEDITPQLKSTGRCTSTQEVKRVEQSLSLLLHQTPDFGVRKGLLIQAAPFQHRNLIFKWNRE